ncbi:MAG TPA: hypothetical protein VFE82_11680 [Ramlibacter sp.]|jgi:hypothetical protein|uniref:hypothetical protein n=1 Tax=Ramlibacter sp. TaxID=1917967 RepID=UPI002D654EFC|nr:hypothetical protein [Ramlibacter sp.]HZY19132.1 hypothetical protein [Ramlibacter sp.]
MPAAPRIPLSLTLALACLAGAPGAVHADARVRMEGERIVFEGRITAASAAQFRQLAQDPAVRRLVITSGGGLVGPALDMAETVRERALDVEVPATCLSSCANYVFPAGRRKVLGWAGAVGWHGNMAHVLYLQRTGQGQWSEAAMHEARQLALREAELYRQWGVDGFVCWFGKLPPHSAQDFYALSAADMALFGIRDVTVLDGPPPAGVDAPLRVQVDAAALQAARADAAP